jgi:hypothetical protein
MLANKSKEDIPELAEGRISGHESVHFTEKEGIITTELTKTGLINDRKRWYVKVRAWRKFFPCFLLYDNRHKRRSENKKHIAE